MIVKNHAKYMKTILGEIEKVLKQGSSDIIRNKFTQF